MDKVSHELGLQKHKIGLSMESPVDGSLKTIESFNRQFQLNQFQWIRINYHRNMIIKVDGFNSLKRILAVEKGNKIRWNTLSLGLSRR